MSCHHPLQYKLRCRTPQPGTERTIVQTNTQANVADSSTKSGVLQDNQFRIDAVPPGSALLVGDAAVFNVAGSFCATQAKCTHRGGPLSEGRLDGSTLTCPWHGAQFNVCTGAVLRGPATEPIKTYRVIVEGEIGRLEGQ
ncbi:MAG: non-heme iron oxygenase ferredoxin subunit [Acidobacteriia bacterium]|nr:non-heme iron oxygenase ferredoxin subunit [Terriglobia bacterium]